MSDKLRGATTINTEHRTYLTDSLSRKGVSRATVAARSNKIEQKTVEVTLTQPYTITKHSNKFLQITCAFPVIATFIPGVPETEIPDLPTSTYTTGILYVLKELEAGSPISVSLYDPDLSAATTQVTVFNATTGETEFLTLSRLPNGLYQGEIPTFICRYRGEDFDGFMSLQPTDTVRIIYNDGRGSSGDPVAVVHTATVVSSTPVPELFVRRTAPIDGNVSVSIKHLPDFEPPTVTVLSTLTADTKRVTLNRENDEYTNTFQPSALFPTIVEGDVLLVEYLYTDIFNSPVTLAQSCVIGIGDTEGILTVPASVKRGAELTVTLDDPDVDVPFVDLIISGNTTGKFERWRSLRVAIGSGLYTYTTTLPALFDNDTSITVTYADSSAGSPVLVQEIVSIIDVGVTPEVPVIPPTTPTVPIEQFALQMEINGLFTLNGRFSGIVRIRAKENETVQCSILQAS